MRRAALFLSLALVLPAAAQEPPKVAGTDVPAPRRTRFVAPSYPAEAQARGQRGIVILELVIDEQGRVATADVVRSVPPFDEAALAAARQWEYEVTRVDGKPVRVRVTVPITFALKLPEMTREPGVPEMRQGAVPGFPPGLDGPSRVVAAVTLQPDGSVAEAEVVSGDSPWSEALLLAVRTWRFVPSPAGTQVSFTVQADFLSPSRPGQPPRVDLKLSAPRTREVAAADPAPAVSPEPDEDTSPPAPAFPAPASEPTAATPGAVTVPETTDPPVAEPSETPADASPDRGVPAAPATPAPPEEEVISLAPPTPAPPTPPPPQPGFSAVRDITLAIGVPDLVKGRRPVVPPVARMAGTGGHVLLALAVDAAGITTVQKADGPELLKEAARQTAASWTFRRTSAERIFLEAVITFEGDAARAEVRPAQQ